MHRPDGSYMFDDDKNDGTRHVDTSCFFMTRAVITVLARWIAMPKQVAPVCDTVYLETIKRGHLPYAHDPALTVCFRTVYESDFLRMAEPMPIGVKRLEATDAPFHWIDALSTSERKRVQHELGWPPGLPAKVARRLGTMKTRLLLSQN
jgi:hypothetical protein